MLSVPLLLSVSTLNQLFPGIDEVEISIPASELNRPPTMFLPLVELMTIAAICKKIRPRKIFEIGTFTGSTTSIIAKVTPPDTEIFTLDLPPVENHIQGQFEFQIGESFQGKSLAYKIHQLFGDSRTFNFKPYSSSIDLVFIDANHTYDFVRSDSERAFDMLRPGGIVIWDDYVWEERFPECAGVAQYLNELSQHRPCYQIAGTRLAVLINV
jgi:predicted O-methyltransferase YrrM